MSTKYKNTLWQIFSIYHIPTTSDYIRINFDSNEGLVNFGNIINKNDIILTLSTCYGDYEKMVLHAKLIKRELK